MRQRVLLKKTIMATDATKNLIPTPFTECRFSTSVCTSTIADTMQENMAVASCVSVCSQLVLTSYIYFPMIAWIFSGCGAVTIILRQCSCAYDFCIHAGGRHGLKGFRLSNSIPPNRDLTNYLVSQEFKNMSDLHQPTQGRERFPAMVRNLLV